jgi:hypothetical protein
MKFPAYWILARKPAESVDMDQISAPEYLYVHPWLNGNLLIRAGNA